ncbi:MAG: ATP-binding protein [Bryobacterales bacterium]|nr:ATP-binding protein [Bryobacterales bacterium]
MNAEPDAGSGAPQLRGASFSLKARLRLAIVALAVLVVSAVSLLNLHRLAEARFEDFSQRAQMAAQQIKTFLIYRVRDLAARQEPGPATLEEAIALWEQMVREDADLAAMLDSTVASARVVVEILIADRSGRVLASSNRTRVGSAHTALPELEAWGGRSPWQKLRQVLWSREDYQTTVALGLPGRQEPVFSIHVVVSSVLLRDELLPLLTRLGLIFAASLGLSLALAVMVSNWSLRPLARISEAIERITRGEYTPAADNGAPEAAEVRAVRSKLNLLGEQFRGAREDAVQLRSNIERLLEQLREVVLLFDRHGRLVLAGRAAEELLGRARWELLGRTWRELFPPQTPLGSALRIAVEEGRVLRDQAATLEREGQPPAQLLVNVDPLEAFPDREPMGLLVTLRDAETRQQIRSQLDVSARLAAISRLTGGVAHEIKNPLNAIALHLEVLRSKLAGQGQDVPPEIETIQREITRLDRVVKTFLDFTRPVEPRMATVEMVGLLREIVALVEPAAAQQNVGIALAAEPEEIFVQGDRDLLKQAILNVVVNAVEAMKDGGCVRLSARLAGAECVLEVTDQGPGIPEDIRDRIFQLYFSTKGKGSGIGLAVTFRVVQLHNGTIDFTTEVGRGTTFRLGFPARSAAPEGAPS